MEAHLSVYADPFFPKWLQDIADLPSQYFHTFFAPLDPSQVPVEQYAAHVYPIPLLNSINMARCNTRVLLQQRIPYAASTPTARFSRPFLGPLSSDSYAERFLPLVVSEYLEMHDKLASATLFDVVLKRLPTYGHQQLGQLFEFEAKTIREGWPPCQISDAVWLKPFNWTWNTPTNTCFEAKVHALRRQQGSLIVRCDVLPPMEQEWHFVVQWGIQDHMFEAARSALDLFHMALSATSFLNDSADFRGLPSVKNMRFDMKVACSWLFPDLHHNSAVPTADADVLRPTQMNWVDPDLNEEQRQAAWAIALGKRRVPFLISGPPGTGKTKTIVETILQILKHNPAANILVCAGSNPSTDTIARRLIKSGISRQDFFRLNHPSRPVDECPLEIQPFCCFSKDGDNFQLPHFQELLQFRVVATSTVDASLLAKYHLSNSSLQALLHYTQSLIHPRDPDKGQRVSPPHWTHLLVDEAAQSTESDTLIPLSVLLPLSDPYEEPLAPPQVILCGDPQQLGPIVNSEFARLHDFECSLLDRLLKRPLYADHPDSRKHSRSDGPKVTQVVQRGLDVPFINLVRNYRSHTAILAPPSLAFYEDSLLPCASEAVLRSQLAECALLPRPGFPMAFFGTDEPEKWVDEGVSFYNDGQLQLVIQLVEKLLDKQTKDSNLRPSEISVLSPFREQVWRIRLALRKKMLHEVDVGNVEALQGAENRVIILSTVRSDPKFLSQDQDRGQGLFKEPRRLCVSLTRAKELLIIIGNPELLRADPWWRDILEYCVRQGCYKGKYIESLQQANHVSRLEVDLEALYGELPHQNKAEILASTMASMTLLDP